MAEKYKNKFDKLANAPIKGLISSLAVPTILSMLVSAFYNMADSFFVGKINTQSVASIGIVFSIMTLLQAIGFFLGNGSGIMISTLLGEKNKKKAEIYANVALFTVIGVGVLLAIIGLFFSKSIALMLGATKTTAHYASTYLKYILLGSPFILGSFVLNNQLRYQGSALYSMIGILTGSIINIALDPLFIFTFKLEVAGAALATAVSQIISFFILYFGTFKNENIRVSLKLFKPSKEIYLTIFKNGLPSLSRQGIGTIANIAMNFACAPYGDAVIAGMSVYNRVMFIGMAVVIGYGQGYQPVCSFNHGAKKYERVYQGYKYYCSVGYRLHFCAGAYCDFQKGQRRYKSGCASAQISMLCNGCNRVLHRFKYAYAISQNIGQSNNISPCKARYFLYSVNTYHAASFRSNRYCPRPTCCRYFIIYINDFSCKAYG